MQSSLPSKESRQLVLQGSELPKGFQGKAFKDRVRECGLWDMRSAGGVSCDWLVIRESGVNIINLLFPKGLESTFCGKHTVNFFHLMGVSVSSKNLQGYGSEYYVWPLSDCRSLALFSGSTIIIFSRLTVFLSAFSQVSDPVYSLELGKGLEDESVSTDKRHVEDMVGRWSVVGKPLRVLLSCIYAIYYMYL